MTSVEQQPSTIGQYEPPAVWGSKEAVDRATLRRDLFVAVRDDSDLTAIKSSYETGGKNLWGLTEPERVYENDLRIANRAKTDRFAERGYRIKFGTGVDQGIDTVVRVFSLNDLIAHENAIIAAGGKIYSMPARRRR